MMSACPRRPSRQQPNSSRRRHYLGLPPLRALMMPANFKPSPLSPSSQATFDQLPSPRRQHSLNEYLPPPSPTKSVTSTGRSKKRSRQSLPKPLNIIPEDPQANQFDYAPRWTYVNEPCVLPISPTTVWYQSPPRPVHDLEVSSTASSPPSQVSRTSAQSRSKSAQQKPKIGPFKLLRQLQVGSFGAPFAAQDLSTNRVICTRVISKTKLNTDDHFLRGILTEFFCFKHISIQPAAQRAYLMSLHGVLQDEDSIFFAMVRSSTSIPFL